MTNIYRIKKEEGMNVPGIIYASKKFMSAIKEDEAINQIKNVAKLPGIIKASIAMPDCHQGYGFTIGGVAAFDLDKGVVSPGGVGYDINCGIRILKTNLTKKEIEEKKGELSTKIYNKVPSGVGRGSPFQLSKKQLDEVLKTGAKWIVEKKGYGIKSDYINCEESGCLKNSDPSLVSEKAKKRGIGQVGTLGAGNHFLEIQEVSEIFDNNIAKVFGLKKGQIVIMIHCGSRGLGHQVASDYIKLMEEEYGTKKIPDRQLISAPIKSKLGKEYIKAMNCAANLAFANRQVITHWTREAIKEIFPKAKIETLYDVCHNIAKIEKHTINGKEKEICVHRKGATRSFGPGKKEVPKKYRDVGQPVLIAGSMGTSSYILAGTKESEEKTFGSTAHGAGRVLSRFKAIKKFDSKKIREGLTDLGILVKSGSDKGLKEEAPEAYKDIDEVIRIISKEKLSKKVAKVRPLLVIKG
jgi:tRNA-splicing ligase RtcB